MLFFLIFSTSKLVVIYLYNYFDLRNILDVNFMRNKKTGLYVFCKPVLVFVVI